MQSEFDFGVIGGGLVGASLAYGLAKQGLKVVMFDEADVARRASRGNFALVWVQGKGSAFPVYSDWTIHSALAWDGLAAELEALTGIPLHYRRPGGFDLCLSEEELSARSQALEKLRSYNPQYPFEIVQREQLSGILPDIGPGVVGASYCKWDGDVNSLKLLRSLHMAFSIHGGTSLPGRKVHRIRSGSGMFHIETSSGRKSVNKLILAAGLGNKELGSMVGFDVPIRAQRGELMVTEKVDQFLHYPMSVIRQTNEGGIMIGDSHEETDDYNEVTMSIQAGMANRAVRMFPRLKALHVVRMWSALRVLSRDGYPIYAQSKTHPGAYLATCHSGVTLAAAHVGRLIPWIVTGANDSVINSFGLERFNVDAA